MIKEKLFYYWVLLLLLTPSAYAFSWADLWLTKDQQGAHALAKNKAQIAATLFQDHSWQGVANYKAGNFDQAAKNFAQHDTAVSNYNRGNALAKAQKYQEAIDAYNRALQQQPNFPDAKFNRDLVEKLLTQQRQKQDSNSQNKNTQSQQKNEQNQQQSSNSQQNSQNSQTQQPNSNSQNNNRQANSSAQQAQSASMQKNNSSQEQQKSLASNQQQSQQNSSADTNKDKASAKNQASQKTANTTSNNSKQIKEQQQANQQLLDQIPDDPGGLLRQKFLRDYERGAE